MRLTDERLCELRRFADITKHPTMTDLLDTIEALQQENEQLQAQAARMWEALRKAREAIKAAWGDGSANAAMDKASEALAAIDKVIGGGE